MDVTEMADATKQTLMSPPRHTHDPRWLSMTSACSPGRASRKAGKTWPLQARVCRQSWMSFFPNRTSCRTRPCADKGVQSLSLSLSHCLSWIVPCANLCCFFYWPSGEQVLSLCSVPLVSCTTLQVFVTLGGGKGRRGAASTLLEATKQEESLLQKNLLLLEKFWISWKTINKWLQCIFPTRFFFY